VELVVQIQVVVEEEAAGDSLLFGVTCSRRGRDDT
jgi:hypothetical protein